MSDDERDLTSLSGAEEDLAAQLVRLGPVIREQERIETEMDPAFVRNLRAHLVYGEERAPHPGFARNLRARLMGETSGRPVPKSSQQPMARWIGTVTVGLVAILGSVLLAVFGPQLAHRSHFGAPYPTRADLIFSFPAPGAVIHRLAPIVSLVHPRHGVPYAGHLRLSAPRLPTAPPKLHAYRLAYPSNVVAVDRYLLDIRAPVRRVVAGSATWVVATDGGFPSRRPLHSLAVSLGTGELIYHDRRNRALSRATKSLPRGIAVTVARRWLTRLGWPGVRMPLVAVETVESFSKVREVEFGWIGIGRAATDAATLWVTPNRSVIEAWVWPPVVQEGSIVTRAVSAAWMDVQKGKLPLAVEGISPATPLHGVGSVQRTSVVSILSSRRLGSLYLVPTYRFEGKAHIPGASVHTWYSLAPSTQR